MKTARRLVLASQILACTSFAAVETGGFIWNAPHNWAVGGAASQSTTGFGGVATRANDGNTNGVFGGNSVSHTATGDATPTWQVDFGTSRPIDQIVLWNRTDCCGERLSNFRVSVLDAVGAEVWGSDFYTGGGNVGLNEMISPPAGTSGKQVKVSLYPGVDRFLSLAEVQVIQNYSTSLTNIALGKVATQSSIGYGGDPSRAVDGNTSGVYGDNSVTHTDDTVATGTPVFWEVDLAGDYSINEIALWNRSDCCGTRLSNFRVSVFDGATEVWGSDYFVGAGNAGGIFSLHDPTGAFFTQGDRVRVSYIGGLNNEGDTPGGRSLSLAEVQVFGQVVPEPGTLGLLSFGGLMLVRRRRGTN